MQQVLKQMLKQTSEQVIQQIASKTQAKFKQSQRQTLLLAFVGVPDGYLKRQSLRYVTREAATLDACEASNG